MNNYKELGVWQKAVGLAVDAYKLTAAFPKAERYGLTIQIRKAATSIPANIAEGWGRGSTKEYIQFLLIARGSLMEFETHLVVCHKLQYVNENEFGGFKPRVEEIGKMLNSLIRSLRSH